MDDKFSSSFVFSSANSGYRAFSHDVTAAILVLPNNEVALMLVYPENPLHGS